MKKRLQRIVLVAIILFLACLFNTVKAATYNISPSKTDIQVGDSVQVTVTANAGAWGININAGGLQGDTSGLAGQTDTTANKNVSKTYTFTAPKAGTYTINVTGDITDYDTDQITKISTPITITVAEKPAQQQEQQPAQQQPAQNQQPAQQQAELQFSNMNSTMYTKSGINLRSSPTTKAQNVITTLKAGTEVKISAKSTSQRDGLYWYKASANGKTGYIADTTNLTTTKPAEPEEKKEEEKKEEENKEKSTNKALKDIVVENYKLTPDFNPETTKYSLEVTKDVEKLEITPILQDDKAKFDIQGNENFKVGSNTVKITVTAEDGTARIYSITVTKTNKEGAEDTEETGLKLKKLQINNAKLEPEFDADVTNYSITVSDPASIKVSDIIAEAEDEDINVTIAEAEANKNGERVITIMLENSDGTQSAVYQVTIKKAAFNPIAEIQKNTDKKVYYILGGIIGILLIAIIVIIVLLKKTSKPDDMKDIKEADELSDDYDYSLKNAIDEANAAETPKYDEMVENADVKSQILSTEEYNVFEDKGNEFGVSDETKRFDLNDDERQIKGKKKGKHF